MRKPPSGPAAAPRKRARRPRGWTIVEPTLNDGDYLESFLTDQQESAHSGGSRTEMRERSTVWTA